MKKLTIIIIAVLLSAAVYKTFQVQIAKRLYTNAVARTLGSSPLTALDGGLHVLLIGTGSPLSDESRVGPSTAVIADGKFYIIDSGGGAVRKMGELRLPMAHIDRVFLTHFHSDHIDGLGELLLQSWAGGGSISPLPVMGPVGVDTVVGGINAAYALDKTYRVEHHGADIVIPSGFGGAAEAFDVSSADVIFTDGDLQVSAFSVNHSPVSPAVGYRFDYKGRSVSITGDSTASPALLAPIKGSDLLITEALKPEMVKILEDSLAQQGADRFAKIMSDIPNYHMSPIEAAKLGQDADVGEVVLTHIVPALPQKILEPWFMEGTKETFDGETVLGRDGLLFTLPIGSDKVLRKQL